MTIGEQVKRRLDEEKDEASKVADKFRKERITPEPPAFFSKVFERHKAPWSNIPKLPAGIRKSSENIKRQVDIATHLIMGEAPIIDLAVR